MKLLYISVFPPELGGISEFSERNYNLLLSPGIDVIKAPFTGTFSVFKILQQANSVKPDIIRVEYNFPTLGFLGFPLFLGLYIYKKFNKVKLWVNYHEVKREFDTLGAIGVLIYRLYSAIFDKITVHTKEAKDLLIEHSNVDEKKIAVVPHGIYKTNQSNIKVDEVNSKFNLGEAFLIVLFGFIHIDKGFEYVLYAIKNIKDKSPKTYEKLKVVIAGDVRERSLLFKMFEEKDHKYKALLHKLTEDLDIKDKVIFTGYLEKPYVYPILERADLFVLPYTNTEQSGVLNQAIPFHTPIIASKIGGLGETLENYGVLVTPKNSDEISNEIIKLIEETDYYNKIVENYKVLENSLSFEKISQEYLDIIKSL